MKQQIGKHIVWVTFLIVGLAHPVPHQATSATTVEYEVWMKEPHRHYFDVALTVTGLRQHRLDVIMPVWTPGSYLIREYARHVVAFSAVDESGAAIPANKVSKNVWRVRTNGASKITARYRVYAFNANMRENYLDESHAYINGASLFAYVDGLIRHPVRLKINPALGWDRISTGLDPAGGETWLLQAPNYDVLADCPIEIGQHKVYRFTVRSVPHRIAIYGDGNYDPDRLVKDVRRIVETAVALFGEIPYKHYTFIVHLSPTGGGGIEHGNSTSLDFPAHGFEPQATYQRWLSLVAHEFFHLWNVKRIRPKALGPFDYTRENYTRMLWVAEGFTSYYADRLLLQAGFIDQHEYLKRLAQAISQLQRRPGRLVQSVAEASFDAWIKYYRQNENSVNTTVSYYNKGEILAALLDLEIRHRSDGARSLDDVMRTAYQEFYKKRNTGYSEEDFRQLCEQVAGGDLNEYFAEYVYSTTEINYDRFLNYAGLRLVPVVRHDPAGYFGAQLQDRQGQIVVTRVLADTPSYRSGVYVGDQITEIDGLPVDFGQTRERLGAKKPGDQVKLTILRRGVEHIVDVILGRQPVGDYRIEKLDLRTPEQEAIYRGWVSSD